MKTILVALLFLPAISAAEVIIQNSGSIESHTSSSASTGGNEVDNGGSVTTGNASASSKSEVTSDGAGSVHIETSTEVNGEQKTQIIDKTIESGESVSVEVNSKSVSGQKPATSVKINGEEVQKLASTTTAEMTATAETEANIENTSFLVSLTSRISIAVKSFFNVFKFW